MRKAISRLQKRQIDQIAPSAKTIGIEKADGCQFFWSLQMLEDFAQKYPQYEFVDGTLAFQRARMIKTPWEIEKIRSVCYITEKAIEKHLPWCVRDRHRKRDSKEHASKMAADGVDKFSYLTVTSGIQKYTTLNAYATDRIVQFGELLLVDISGHIDGYASDLTRMMYLGNEIPKDIYDMAKASSDCVIAGKEYMKPGRKNRGFK